MKKKRLLILLLIIVFLFAQFGVERFFNSSSVFAADVKSTEWNRYFYNQLSGNAKNIYDAMFEMYSKGIFARGESMEITDRVDATSVALFVNGNDRLISEYGAARDAFQYDYPDCFYVDWDELSVRVAQDSTGKLHTYLGAGRSDTYLLEGMNESRSNRANGGHGTGIQGAIKQYEEILNKVVEQAKGDSFDVNNVEDVVRAVGDAHDYITRNMIYKYDYEVTRSPIVGEAYDKSSTRTAYDGLIYGEGVCEAYTRTFKAVLDRLGVPCICVYGMYSPKPTLNEPHIWNYVYVNGQWYGVDVTHDDPSLYMINVKNGGKENRDYFLVGKMQLNSHHFPSGIVSSANYEFTYPELAEDSYRDGYLVDAGDGFYVKVEKDTQMDDQTNQNFASGTFWISYNGKNFTQNAQEGKYLIIKYLSYSPGTQEWVGTDWSYLDPWTASYGEPTLNEKIEPKETKDGNYCVRLELPQVEKIQLAVTDIAPGYRDLRIEYEKNGWSSGLSDRIFAALNNGAAHLTETDGASIKVMTEEIDNKWGDYEIPPTAVKCTPRQGGSLYIGSTHHIKLEFTDELIKSEPDSEVSIAITTTSGAGAGIDNAGWSAIEYARIKNVNWSGNVVEFDFTPSTMFSDNHTFYHFQVKGLIGKESLKAPYPVTYGLTFPCCCYVNTDAGYARNVFAHPQLMESKDMDISKWEVRDADVLSDNYGQESSISDLFDEMADENGANEDFLNTLKNRLTLVTAEANQKQSEQMGDVLEESKYKDDFEKAQSEGGTINTYNISLITCKKMVVRTGQKVRVSLGFPRGTTYEDFLNNLSFKAYHYKVDPATDKLTGEVEEIPVTVTRQGLILFVDSFSPFTITSFIDENAKKDDTKNLLLTTTVGGNIMDGGNALVGENAEVVVNKDETKTFNIIPNEGYEIDYVMIDGVRQNVTDKSNYAVEISYDSIESGSVLSAGFVATEIHENEAKGNILSSDGGKTAQLSSTFSIPTFNITLDKRSYEFIAGEKVEISPVVTVTGENIQLAADENFDPTTATANYHPDYIKYQWYDNLAGRVNGSPYSANSAQVQKTYFYENAPLKLNGMQGYLSATVMKWQDGEYKEYYIDGAKVAAVGPTISIKVYPELNLELNGDETEGKPQLNKDENNKYTLKLSKGDMYKLNATTYRLYDNGKRLETNKITWKSSKPEIVSVDNSGHLTVKEYQAEPVTITASVVDKNGTKKVAEVAVTVKNPEITEVSLEPTELELEVGEYKSIIAKVTPEDADLNSLKWSIKNPEDEKYVTVTSDGEVRAVSLNEGEEVTVTVVATASENVSAECQVTVKKTYVTEIAEDIEEHLIRIPENKSIEIYAEAIPKNATNRELTWEISQAEGANVATVEATTDEDGISTATVTAGAYNANGDNTCTLTVTAEGSKDPANKVKVEFQIEVVKAEDIERVENVEIVPNTAELTVGKEGVDLNVEIVNGDATVAYKEVSWKVISDDKGVISIDSTGYVTPLKKGTATVEVTAVCQYEGCKGHKATATITVNPLPVDKIVLDKTSLSLYKDETHKLTATAYPIEATDYEIVWASDNSEVVEVDQEGNITAKKVGTAKVTAKVGEVIAECDIEVMPIELEGITLSPSELKLKVDETATLETKYYPEDADVKDNQLVWESDNNDVVTVENGVVTAIAPGDATITVYMKGKKDDERFVQTCAVKVVPSSADVVVYTVDQNGEFIAGITLRLTKLLNGGTEQLVQELPGNGKYVFEGLEDGEYVLREISVPQTGTKGRTADLTQIVGVYEFVIKDGSILYENSDATISTINSIVFVNTTDGTQARVDNAADYDGIDSAYEEFIKNLPSEPGDTGDDNPGDTGDDNTGDDNPGNTGDDNTGDDNPGNTGDDNTGDDNPGNTSDDNTGDDNPGNTGDDNTGDDNPGNTGDDNTGDDNPGNTGDDNNNGNTNGSDVPKTSDIAIEVFAVAMVLSFAGIMFIIYKKRKK